MLTNIPSRHTRKRHPSVEAPVPKRLRRHVGSVPGQNIKQAASHDTVPPDLALTEVNQSGCDPDYRMQLYLLDIQSKRIEEMRKEA